MTPDPPRPGACPRCGTPVTGTFKFCPACACRLQPTELPPPEPTAPQDRWMRVLVLLVFGLFVLGTVALGVLLFSRKPPRSAPKEPGEPRAFDSPLSVRRDLLGLMRPLEKGIALIDETGIEVRVHYLRVQSHETTRGMYHEYVRDLQAAPERTPQLLLELWDPPPIPPPPPPIPPGVDEEQRAILARTQAEILEARISAERGHERAEGYIQMWWRRVAEHLRSTQGLELERPADLRVPVPQRWRNLLIVPPSWVRGTKFEDLTWSLPAEEGVIPENLPVTDVSWYDAEAFAAWATSVLQLDPERGFRLPTESEWMRAGRGGDLENVYPWGSDEIVYACNNRNFWRGSPLRHLLPVDHRYSDGDHGKTPEGLWAMSGNAREWARNEDWVSVDGDDVGVPGYWRAEPFAAEDGLADAPTLGGSYDDQIGDCAVDEARYDYKWLRSVDVGFRLMLPGWQGGQSPLFER